MRIRVRRRLFAGVIVLIAGCVAIEVQEREQAAFSNAGQGSDLQGSDLQGSDLQGSDLQSGETGVYYQARWRSTSLEDVKYGVSSVGTASINGGTLSFWRLVRRANLTFGYDQHFPDRICHWNLARTTMSGCTTKNLATEPSPLAGAQFKATFLDKDGNTFEGAVRIGLSTTDPAAVAADTTIAMGQLRNHSYPLQAGQPGPSSCTVVPYDALGTGQGCSNPTGCRVNCDLWQYDVRFVDILDENGEPRRFCPEGHRAVAVAGTYEPTGAYSTSDLTKLTFACTSGTIAKCTRWGYRPFGTASKTCDAIGCTATDNTQYALRDYHQTCVRAARADYCASNRSYTKAGTIIDIFDVADAQKPGFRFVHPTFKVMATDVTAFVTESTFDPQSATVIDHVRYQEILQEKPTLVQTDCFSFAYEANGGVLRRSTPAVGPQLSVESTTACAHDELTLGRTLHKNCSDCTRRIHELEAYPWTYSHCLSFDVNGWDESCRQRALEVCNAPSASLPYDRMARHSECTTGAALDRFDTGCTLKVCGQNPSCCDTAGPLAKDAWNDSCVALANAKCFGGQEAVNVGFCGMPLPSSPK